MASITDKTILCLSLFKFEKPLIYKVPVLISFISSTTFPLNASTSLWSELNMFKCIFLKFDSSLLVLK